MFADCTMMTGSMSWMMLLMGGSLLLLVGLGIAALIKYLFSRQEVRKFS